MATVRDETAYRSHHPLSFSNSKAFPLKNL